jgi:hypothetical protein
VSFFDWPTTPLARKVVFCATWTIVGYLIGTLAWLVQR